MSILIVRRGIQGPRGLSGLAARETLAVAANMETIIAVSENLDIIANAPIDAAHISYNNSTSGLASYTAQQAIDEVVNNMSTYKRVTVGEIISGLWSTAPEGSLALAGQTGLSRTTYSKLFAHLTSLGLIVSETGKAAHQFGDGDGSTTFSMADWRSQFFRSVGGVRALGSYQADAYKLHGHTLTDPTHKHNSSVGVSDKGGSGNGYAYSDNAGGSSIKGYANPGGGTTMTATGITIAESGDTETRPANIALMYCITTGEFEEYYTPPGDPIYLDATVTEDYTVGAYVSTIFVNASAAVEITLPTPTTYREVWIKDIAGTAGSYNITVIGDIEGDSSYVIGANYGGVTLRWNGAEWSIKA